MAKCKVCKQPYTPSRMGQVVCCYQCAQKLVETKREKTEKVKKAVDRKETKAKLEQMKPISHYRGLAQKAIQQFRRLEELSLGSGCISCGRTQDEVQQTDAWKPGGAWDGGHFLSKGARPELSLEPLNIWLQCKSCNGGSGKYARKAYTVGQSFEKNLIERIGQEKVDWLQGPHPLLNLSKDEYKEIELFYRQKTKELINARS